MSFSGVEIRPLAFDSNSVHDQEECRLFTVLPAEIRDLIFAFTLAPFEDPDPAARFDVDTCFKRPNYSAPHKSDTALLRTCKRIYSEAWFRPWTASEQTFYFTHSERRPDGSDEGVQTVDKMQAALYLFYELHGDVELEGGVRIFAQLWALERGDSFNRVMDMQYFSPRIITVTIRHTDWWWWEYDDVMRIRSEWIGRTRIPNSVRELRLEFESLERRKEQVDSLADQACEDWAFTRRDGELLTASKRDFEIDRWTGSSTWEGCRWEEDEAPGKPGVLDYYVKTIVFRQHPCPTKDEPGYHLYTRSHLIAPEVGLRATAASEDD